MRRQIAALLVLAALGQGCHGGDPVGDTMVVFAAASLRDVARDLGEAFERHHDRRVVFNFAGSNTLARQIRAAPRVDLFLSADEGWVEFVEDTVATVPGARGAIFGNRLVAIRHLDSELRPSGPAELGAAPFRHLALADPVAVPAGRYARAYLERAGAWPEVAERVVPALDVRAALALVASDPEIVGIVYRTDVAASDRVRVLFELEPIDDLPILYWAVAIHYEPDLRAGVEFLQFLGTAEAREIVVRHGFTWIHR